MLEEKDRVIIQHLRADARSKLTALSKQTDIPLSTLYDRLTRLTDQQNIRLVTLLNYRELRLPLHCWVLLKAKDKEQAQEHLLKHPSINTLLAVNNGADFALEAVFRDFKEYNQFLEELSEHGKIQEHPVIEEVCKEKARVAT